MNKQSTTSGVHARFVRYGIVAIAFIAFVCGQAAAAPSARAATCGPFQGHHAGYITNAYGGSQPRLFEGAKALITDRNGYSLCTSDTSNGNFSTAWSMIASHDLNGWAQSGPYLWWGSAGGVYCVDRWAQQKTISGTPINYFIGGCSVANQAHYYWQQATYDGTWHIRSNIDQTVIHQSTWSPFSNFTSPFEVQFSTETHYLESRIPGTPSLPEDYSLLQVQDRANDNFYDACGNVGLGYADDNQNQWSTDAPHCNHIRTWQIH